MLIHPLARMGTLFLLLPAAAMPSVSILTVQIPQATIGAPYSFTLQASGGVPPYVWSAASPLPFGLTLGSSGVVTGPPSGNLFGCGGFMAAVTDAAGASASGYITVCVNTAPVFDTHYFWCIPWTVNRGYSQQLGAGGGTGTLSYSIASGSLPPGLTFDSATAIISGTPTKSGSFSATLRVTDSYGASGAAVCNLVINPWPVITAGPTLPPATVGTAYTLTLSEAGGTPYISWVQTAPLPDGFSLAEAGVLSGTPSTAGSYVVSVQLVDSTAASASAKLSLKVNALSSLGVVTASPLPTGTLGTAYAQDFKAGAGVPPYTWSIASGTLPPGLTLQPLGHLAGTLTGPGTFNFTLQVNDSAGAHATKLFSLTVNPAPLAITNTTLPDATVGQPYSATLSATGGVPPYHFELVGYLPAGLSLDPDTGTVRGTPTYAQPALNSDFRVIDSFNNIAFGRVYLAVLSQITLLTTSLPNAEAGVPYSYTLTAGNGVPPYQFGTGDPMHPLPPGITLSTSGVLSGLTTATGSYPLLIGVRDAAGGSAGRTLTLLVTSGVITISPAALPHGEAHGYYAAQLSATGGVPPYSWALSSGDLPSQLTLNAATGMLSGNGAGFGYWYPTIRVSDSTGRTAYQPYTLIFGTGGDFNGDGYPDLVWMNAATRQVTVHYYLANNDSSWTWLASAGYPGWHLVAAADFDGNGVPDLVWMNDATRQVTVHFYGGAGGATDIGWSWLALTGYPGWSVVGTGDFDGNGVLDLVWMNDTTRQVTVHYYDMRQGALTDIGWSWLAAAGYPGWTVRAVADFDGNGVPDLVWENDATAQVTVHYYGGSGGASDTGWQFLSLAIEPGWTVVGATDFDFHGVPDLVWQNDTTAQVTLHFYVRASGSVSDTFWTWLAPGGYPGWKSLAPK